MKNLLYSSKRRGFALVLVLSLTILLSFLVVAFTSKSIQGFRLAQAQSIHYRTDLFARSALQTLMGDLRRELENGSSIENLPSGERIYLPKSRWAQFPTKSLQTSEKSLLKVSRAGSPFTLRPECLAEDPFACAPLQVRSDEADIKGRKIPLEQWNRPWFQEAETILDQAPDWVLMSRGGIFDSNRSAEISRMTDRASNNRDYVIGRFSYVIYNEGGLLNVNEAGAPSAADDDYKTRKGGLSQVNLNHLPGISNGGKVADWRGLGAAGDFSEFKKSHLAETKTPERVLRGNRAFLSRKDFIHYAEQHPSEIPMKSLKYFTTFHRSLDAPSMIPDPKRPKTSVENNALGLDNAINPAFNSVKNLKGSLLLKRRFPLNRLSLLEKGTDAQQIEKYFGLKKASAPHTWTYDHGNPQKILRLSEVSLLGREPDFFETLKAAISVGSLGKRLDYTCAYYLLSGGDQYHIYTDNQVIQIGLSLIDQWDEDSYPTRIYFDNNERNEGEFYGTENLPGLYRLCFVPHQQGTGPGTPVEMWVQPELWNPHQPNFSKSAQVPEKIRFVGKGRVYFFLQKTAALQVTSAPKIDLTDVGDNLGVECSPTMNQSFREPTVLTRLNSTAFGSNLPADSTYQFMGLYLGRAISPDTTFPGGYNLSVMVYEPSVDFELQYQVDGQWVTYSRMEKVSYGGVGYHTGSNGIYPHAYMAFLCRSDPRSSRFGVMQADSFEQRWPGSGTQRPDKGIGSLVRDLITYYPSASNYPGWTFSPKPPAFAAVWWPFVFLQGLLSENGPTSSTRYQDPDGVLRGSDGVAANGSTDDGYPQIAANLESRPVILNRPFRSVGEMGYGFRDMPWKTVDFFTEKSADAALLDYFSLQESDESAVVSHQIDLNSPYEEIVAARLNGASKRESDLTQALSPAQARSIARQLISNLQDEAKGPIQNRSDLVTNFISKVDYGNSSDNIIKTRREATVRALANDSDTRTWNLMIDLVAQTGGYPSSARKLADFNVQGQARYWVHLAIDRFTGKILETKWEKVVD